MKESGYVSPVMELWEIEPEGLICVSGNEVLDENEGYW